MEVVFLGLTVVLLGLMASEEGILENLPEELKIETVNWGKGFIRKKEKFGEEKWKKKKKQKWKTEGEYFN